MTTGMLDRHDQDIMLETALCKIFCSEMGWRVVNDAMQIMGGESYMTENELERTFRDSRINMIVEGANEVMQSFVFAYGGKQLAEHMLGVQQAVGWENENSAWKNFARGLKSMTRPGVMKAALPLAKEMFMGIKRPIPAIDKLDPSLHESAQKLAELVRDHSHQFKLASKRYGEKIVSRQAVQARLADSAMWLHAWACTLSKLDHDIRAGSAGAKFERDRTAATHFFDLAKQAIGNCFKELSENTDDTMLAAAQAELRYSETLPNSEYVIHEASPNAKSTGRKLKKDGIKQFPGDSQRSRPATSADGNGDVAAARITEHTEVL